MIDWDTYHTKEIEANYLYRYFPRKRLFQFIETSQLYFSRLDQFDDQLEGITAHHAMIKSAVHYLHLKERDMNPSMTEDQKREFRNNLKRSIADFKDRIDKTQKSHFASCWFLGDTESIAMWRLFGKTKGYAVKVNRIKLQERFKEIALSGQYPENTKIAIAGKITYKSFSSLHKEGDNALVKYLAFRKDSSFDYEREYRLCFGTLGTQSYKGFALNLGSLEDLELEIIPSPLMSQKEYERVKHKIKEINPNISVKRSSLVLFFQFRTLTKHI